MFCLYINLLLWTYILLLIKGRFLCLFYLRGVNKTINAEIDRLIKNNESKEKKIIGNENEINPFTEWMTKIP